MQTMPISSYHIVFYKFHIAHIVMIFIMACFWSVIVASNKKKNHLLNSHSQRLAILVIDRTDTFLFFFCKRPSCSLLHSHWAPQLTSLRSRSRPQFTISLYIYICFILNPILKKFDCVHTATNTTKPQSYKFKSDSLLINKVQFIGTTISKYVTFV